jgi:hypothetical protein
MCRLDVDRLYPRRLLMGASELRVIMEGGEVEEEEDEAIFTAIIGQ